MRILRLASILSCLLSTFSVAVGEQYAVLVGVEQYQHSNLTALQYAVEDVTELAAQLTKSGYTVKLLTDDSGRADDSLKPTRANIEKQIRDILSKCGKEDTVILAFAGHGLQFTGQKDAYFCPVDARPFHDETDSMVSISKIYSELEKSFAGVKVIFVDACRNDPDPGRGRGGLDADAAPRPPRGVAALFSCSAGQRAFEHDDLKHGVFFHYILEGLKKGAVDRRGRVTFDGLSAYVRENVPERVRKLFPEQKFNQFPNLKADLVGVPPVLARVNTNETLAELLRSAEANNADAQTELGEKYAEGDGVARNDATAHKWYLKAAEQGHVKAQNNLGVMYANGLGVPKNEVEAVRWYQKAALQGNPEAQNNLGLRYISGGGVPPDDKVAMKWFRLAAEQNYSEAQNNLGVMYAIGRGVSKNEVEAVRWYRKAAILGNVNGQKNLGFMYANGFGVAKSASEAIVWYLKAAHRGHAEAQFNMGVMYQNGTGVAKNRIKAIEWYRKAAAQGIELANERIKSLSQ